MAEETITIYEDWDERPDGVYYRWRLPGERQWHERLTAYKQKPVLYRKVLSKKEFEERYEVKNPTRD